MEMIFRVGEFVQIYSKDSLYQSYNGMIGKVIKVSSLEKDYPFLVMFYSGAIETKTVFDFDELVLVGGHFVHEEFIGAIKKKLNGV